MRSAGHYGPDGKGHSLEEIRRERSAMSCEHANENPAGCRFEPDCYCKFHTCKKRSGKVAIPKIPFSLQEQLDKRILGHQYAYELLRDAIRKTP